MATTNETLESLEARHKKEQKELIAQSTSLRKSVTKGEKARRKEVLAEVECLEKTLKERHERERRDFQASVNEEATSLKSVQQTEGIDLQSSGISQSIKLLNLNKATAGGTQNGVGKPRVNRQKARMARRAAEIERQRELAAEEADNMPDLSAREQKAMADLLAYHHLQEEAIRPDGNCLYAAFASQLGRIRSEQFDHKTLRRTAAAFIREHKDDFEPFLSADDHTSAKDIDSYCKEIEETALWGGDMEITALSRAFDVLVEIYSDRSLSPLVIRPESFETKGSKEQSVVRLAYYHRLFGLGQHYNGLQKESLLLG